eukprot:2828340-Rhodomonas_salina.1
MSMLKPEARQSQSGLALKETFEHSHFLEFVASLQNHAVQVVKTCYLLPARQLVFSRVTDQAQTHHVRQSKRHLQDEDFVLCCSRDRNNRDAWT